MKEIYLLNSKCIVLVDDEDYEWLNQYRWYLNIENYVATHMKINNKKNKKIHRIIMNEPIDFEIDHIDHNKLNNQKCNLRIVTRSQNQMNRHKIKNTSSKYKGVCWMKNNKKWQAQIKFNQKIFYLGLYLDEIDAAKAYNERAKELFGEYAHLNEV